MSSSRSIAAARARRAGEQSQPMQPPNRPVTSINSQAAFAQQQQYQGQQRNQPPMPQGKNVRIASAPMNQPQKMQNTEQSSRPKMTISDAIGLVTLRLGRVESILIEKEHEQSMNGGNIPENCQIVDKSVLATIVARIEALEKNNKDFSQLTNEIKNIKEGFINMNAKIDTHIKDSNERFDIYETALAEIEKQIPLTSDIIDECELSEQIQDDILNNTTELSTPIVASDLKSLIRNELAESSSS